MNTIMSTTIIPDIYRHTARKSTVSRNVKNLTYNHNKNFKDEQSIFDTIQCDIKFEKDLSNDEQTSQTYLILHENEIEQMNIEQTNEQIIGDLLEQIINKIPDEIPNLMPSQNRTLSTDIHHVIDSLMDHIDEPNLDQTHLSIINDVQMEDLSSIESQSFVDDDIVEIEASTSNLPSSSSSCTCQCHQSTSNRFSQNSPNEYLIFEQALRQTRQEHQELIEKNQLVQILKHQHQELINLYHRQIHTNKIDREQQTNLIDQHDQQIQTDLLTLSQNIKTNNQQINGTHTISNVKNTTTISRPFNSFLTPIRTTGPSLSQLIPCLTTTTTMSTTTVTNKTAVIKQQPIENPGVISHDIVDLTEEEEDDDDDNNNGATTKISTAKLSPIKSQPSPVSTTAAASAVVPSIRNQTINRSIRSNLSTVQQPLIRPLSDHATCDYTIVRPQLSIAHDNATVRLTWNLPATPMESILSYEIYAYKQTLALTNSDWKKIGTVKSMRLPMAVTLKEFQSNSHYAFAVRAISIHNNLGPFCEPKTIFTGNLLQSSTISDHHRSSN